MNKKQKLNAKLSFGITATINRFQNLLTIELKYLDNN